MMIFLSPTPGLTFEFSELYTPLPAVVPVMSQLSDPKILFRLPEDVTLQLVDAMIPAVLLPTVQSVVAIIEELLAMAIVLLLEDKIEHWVPLDVILHMEEKAIPLLV